VLGDDGFVSQVHARLYRRNGDVYLEDLGSRNGTYLNGELLSGATRVRRGDQVQFGQTVTEALR
jgi:pSer/pThr/pTyr-binding forkhead associated (FHA) protein